MRLSSILEMEEDDRSQEELARFFMSTRYQLRTIAKRLNRIFATKACVYNQKEWDLQYGHTNKPFPLRDYPKITLILRRGMHFYVPDTAEGKATAEYVKKLYTQRDSLIDYKAELRSLIDDERITEGM